MAKEKAVNIASCLEKSEIVNAIISCQKKFELRHSTATSAVETIAVESSSSSSQESSDDSNQSSSDETCVHTVPNKRTHRKTTNQTRRKSNITQWNEVLINDVDKLPYDIDRLVAYKLRFDPKKRMQSSRDGRPWGTWVTSNRQGFGGVRRSARCKGGYKCKNGNCLFLKIYRKVTKFSLKQM